MSRDQSPILPKNFNFVYRVRRCAGTLDFGTFQPAYVSKVKLSDVTPTDEAVVSGLVGSSMRTRVVRDSAVALVDTPGSDPTNKSNLDALAKQCVQDWLDWATADQPGDFVVSGIAAVAPCGLVDTIEWAYARDECYTRVQSPPLNCEPDELCHFDPDTTACIDANNSPAGTPVDKTPGIDFYGPPETCTGGGATAHATVDSDGHVSGIVIDSGGASYSDAPIVCFSDDGVGHGATATCTLSGGVVASATVTAGGEGYNADQPPIVSFYGGGTKRQKTRRRLFIEAGLLIARFVSYDTIST